LRELRTRWFPVYKCLYWYNCFKYCWDG
jgi:hypothetical protein